MVKKDPINTRPRDIFDPNQKVNELTVRFIYDYYKYEIQIDLDIIRDLATLLNSLSNHFNSNGLIMTDRNRMILRGLFDLEDYNLYYLHNV